MINYDLLAKEAYYIGERSLKRGVAKELLPEVKEFGGGYQAMLAFLLRRGAMVVGDMARPKVVVGHLVKEKDEAVADIDDRDKLILELGDCGFIALVIGGLLWSYIDPIEQQLTRDILVWSMDTAHEHNIDLNNAVVRVANEKNVKNYPEEDLQLKEGETVENVVARLPSIYTMLRARREAAVVLPKGVGVVRYTHGRASLSDHGNAGGAYDY